MKEGKAHIKLVVMALVSRDDGPKGPHEKKPINSSRPAAETASFNLMEKNDIDTLNCVIAGFKFQILSIRRITIIFSGQNTGEMCSSRSKPGTCPNKLSMKFHIWSAHPKIEQPSLQVNKHPSITGCRTPKNADGGSNYVMKDQGSFHRKLDQSTGIASDARRFDGQAGGVHLDMAV
eukprot:CAMPEP_0171328392 /NCGR_PEP_ID=MMETSP0878-20121228/623_1 /TAXON_ID=67004 /ORGANISM="Thalassiosira weissflogii, Strain CCMP1336" /LENGTH=176 /DNA_ID=CAMNT_0011828241 /DNA_START=604 /DNA_END=1135 /DNA_ORIENTATION=-